MMHKIKSDWHTRRLRRGKKPKKTDRAYARGDTPSHNPEERERTPKKGEGKKEKRGQEEMVGFALIIIIVAVILLVFIGFSLKGSTKETVESYEVESFIQSFLQYTTDCKDQTNDVLTIRELILECNDLEKCNDEMERDTCVVLSSTLNGIVSESWKVGDDRPVKGYELNISSQDKSILFLSAGDFSTGNSKGAPQDFVKRGEKIFIYFKAHY